MTASLLSGKACAAQRMETLRQSMELIDSKGLRKPGLAVILVGEDPASTLYVGNKRKACSEAGILSRAFNLPVETTEPNLLDLIENLNKDDTIDGILVQLPLPKHINTANILEHISPTKDVDGFHPCNLGKLAQKNPELRPCTPMGIIHLLNYYEIPLKGKHAVIIGASNIVGRPMGLECLLAGATTSVCHRFTPSLKPFVEIADILILATGVMDLVNPEWLKSHQVLVDVGIHKLADGKIRGDVDFKKARSKVAWITPVPGGVGPMTIISLLENTWFSYKRAVSKESL